jgi:hypothetical protein
MDSLTIDEMWFALSNTTDPDVASLYADRFAKTNHYATPGVFFTPKWVLAKSKGPARLAAYALSNCNDSNTLKDVYKKATRISVKNAIVDNAYLSPAHRKELGLKVTTEKLPFTVDTPRRLRLLYLLRAIATKTSKQLLQQTEIFNILSYEDSYESDVIDEVVRALARSDAFGYISRYLLLAHDNVTQTTNSVAVLRSAKIDPVEVLSYLSPAARKNAIIDFMWSMRPTGVTQPAACISKELTEVIISNTSPTNYTYRELDVPVQLFSSEAIDLLATLPEWYTLLREQKISDKQFATLLSVTPKGKTIRLCSLLHGERTRLLHLADELKNSTQEIDGDNLTNALLCISDPRDPLLDFIAKRVDAHYLSSYMFGNWGLTKSPNLCALPDIRQLPGIVEIFNKTGRSLSAFSVNFSTLKNTSLPYLLALVDLVPGMAYAARTKDVDVDKHMYFKLASCGVDTELALHQFSTHSKSESLDTICTMLRALAKAVDK